MRTLGLKGHETRGKEVIEILEMLGGEDEYKFRGNNKKCAYFEKNGVIHNTSPIGFNNIKLFTLEEFLEKYPYRVGDKVIYTKYGDNDVEIIERMEWTGTTIEYTLKNGVSCLTKDLQLYKKQENMEDDNILNQLIDYFNNTPRDVIEKEWHEYDKYNKIGITVKDYLEYINSITKPNL